MRDLIARMWAECRGATAIEYGLIVCLIMLAIVVGITSVGTQISAVFNHIDTTLVNSPAGQ